MKYTIRYRCGHWQVWRPSMYREPFRGLKAFATAPTLPEALEKVQDDTIKAMLAFSDLTGHDSVDLVEATWWLSAHTRNDWKDESQ